MPFEDKATCHFLPALNSSVCSLSFISPTGDATDWDNNYYCDDTAASRSSESMSSNYIDVITGRRTYSNS